jgi:DNA replication protein DnaC
VDATNPKPSQNPDPTPLDRAADNGREGREGGPAEAAVQPPLLAPGAGSDASASDTQAPGQGLGHGEPPRFADGVGDPDCPHCHGLGYLREDVPPGHPNFGKLQPCMCQLDSMSTLRADKLRRDSNTESLAGKTFDNFLPEGLSPDPAVRATVRSAFERSRTFAEQPERWLLLSGTYGCGKTHLAAAIANRCVALGKPVLFLNTPDLLDRLRAGFAPNAAEDFASRFEEMRTAPILVLDDLGTESPTPWAVEKLYQILNYRYNAQLPTVITTNRELKDIEPRIASRLADLVMVTALTISAPDFRAGHINLTSDVSTLAIHARQTFETFDPRADLAGEARQMFHKAIQAARDYAEAPRGWFVLTGDYGSGKTHLAAAIANHRAQQGQPAIFVTYQDLSDLFRTSSSREADERNAKLVQQVKTTEFLVIDDVSGLVGTAGYFRERFFQVFNYRFDAQLATVLTTAASDKELDPRIKSRIFHHELCQVHLLKVGPYRGKRGKRRG